MANPLFDFANIAVIGSQLFYWLGIFIIIAAVGIVTFLVMHLSSFDYKTINGYDLHFDDKGKPYLGKVRNNRFKFNKDKTMWKSLWPLFNKVQFPPFSMDNILPGKKVRAARLISGIWIPLKQTTSVFKDEQGNVIYSMQDFLPIPQYLKENAILEIKKIEEETKVQNEWEKNRPYLIMGATILFCLLLTGATIYFTFDYATTQAQTIGPGILDSITKGMSTIPSRPA